jgi:hypothetical protein
MLLLASVALHWLHAATCSCQPAAARRPPLHTFSQQHQPLTRPPAAPLPPADGSKFSGPIACARDVLVHDGLRGFLKGWLATYARLGPHTVIMFLTAEELRRAAGLKSL